MFCAWSPDMADPVSLLTSVAVSALGSFASNELTQGVNSVTQGLNNQKTTAGLTPGVSPEQAALAQYSYGQNLLKNEQTFSGGTGHSTMATQGAGGARFKEAFDVATESDKNLAAQFTQLQQLASNAGFNAGSNPFSGLDPSKFNQGGDNTSQG
jgi:hypothetical protein